jgi:hypothetical protein
MLILEILWCCNTGFNWQHDYVRIYSTGNYNNIPSDVLHDVAHTMCYNVAHRLYHEVAYRIYHDVAYRLYHDVVQKFMMT